jgi:hypothetical protein
MERLKRLVQEHQGWKQAMDKVAEDADSQENDSLVMLERLRSPQIFEQMMKLERDYECARRHVAALPAARETLMRDDMIRNIDDARHSTQINTRAGAESTQFSVATNERKPDGTRRSVKELTIIEAHEKFHAVHPTYAYKTIGMEFFDEMYRKALDESVIRWHAQTQKALDYMLSGQEIAARMAQLKNYFGMRGAEAFTLPHLYYAKKHYVTDTGLDNNMTVFLEAVTKKTEGEFIRLINSTGI